MGRAKIWIGIGISLICLTLALRGIEWGQVWHHLSRARYPYLLGAVLFMMLGLAARAFRWQLLFLPRYRLPVSRLFAVSNIGYLLINILPARVGDLARAYLISRGEQISTAHALSTIVVERVYDTLLVVLILAMVSPFIPLPHWAAQGGLTIGVLTLAMAAILFLLGRQTDRLSSLGRWLTQRARAAGMQWLVNIELEKQIQAALEGLAILQHGRVALGVLGWSALVWLCNLIPFHLVMRSLSLDLPWSATGFTVSVAALSMIIPSSPGYVGVFESGVILSLGLFAVQREVALAYALVIHAVVYATANLLGLIGLWQESLSLSVLRHRLDREAWSAERGT